MRKELLDLYILNYSSLKKTKIGIQTGQESEAGADTKTIEGYSFLS